MWLALSLFFLFHYCLLDWGMTLYWRQVHRELGR
jgi:hypothetical protein